MNIAFLSREYPPQRHGGIGTYTHVLAHALSEEGHHVEVISWTNGPEYCETDGPVVVHRVQPHYINALGRRPIRWLKLYEKYPTLGDWGGWSYAAHRKLRELSRRCKFDVIEAPEHYAEGMVTALLGNIPLVVKLHTPAQVSYRANQKPLGHEVELGFRLERLSASQATAVTSPSAAMVDLLARKWRLPQHRVEVIPNPIDEQLFHPPNRARAFDTSPQTILFVGRLEPRKGVCVLAHAFARIARITPDIRLWLAGSDNFSAGTGYLSFEHFIQKELGEELLSRIDFLGSVPRRSLIQHYHESDVCVIPSVDFENFPYTCLEAMACGCSVIGSRCGGIPEMIVHGETGLLVPPSDIDALTAALKELLSNNEMRTEFGRAARRRVETNYSRNAVVRRVVDHYGSLI